MAETLPQALEGLRGNVDAIGYACMATSLLKPAGWHEILAEAAAGVPLLLAGETMIAALAYLGARRAGIFSPYPDRVAGLVPDWFERRGIIEDSDHNAYHEEYGTSVKTSQYPFTVFNRVVEFPATLIQAPVGSSAESWIGAMGPSYFSKMSKPSMYAVSR